MASHDLRGRSFEDGCLCSILQGPLQLYRRPSYFLLASSLRSTLIGHISSHTTFPNYLSPPKELLSTCTLLFPFSARFSALYCRLPLLAFVLTSRGGLPS